MVSVIYGIEIESQTYRKRVEKCSPGVERWRYKKRLVRCEDLKDNMITIVNGIV